MYLACCFLWFIWAEKPLVFCPSPGWLRLLSVRFRRAAVLHWSSLSMLPTWLTIRHHSHCLSSPPSTWAAIMTLIAQELTSPLSGCVRHCALRAICVPVLNRSILHIPKLQKGQGKAPLPFINNVYGVRGMWATVSLCVCVWAGSRTSPGHWRSGEWGSSWHLTPVLSNFTGRKRCQHKVIFYFGVYPPFNLWAL